MQRCHSRILGPFKTNSVISRCESISRTSFDFKCLRKRHQKNEEIFFKGQKNFIWTSLYLFKNEKNGKWTEFASGSTKALNESKTEEKVDAHLKNNPLNASAFCYSESEKIPVSNEQNGEKIKIFLPEENTTAKKIEPQALASMVLPKKNFLCTYFSISAMDATLYAQTKLGKPFLQVCKLSKSAQHSENIKKHDKILDVPIKKDGELKRETLELNLGKITPDISLDLPSNEQLNDKERLLNEIKPLKETPQNILLEKAKGILRKTTVLKSDEDGRSTKVVNLGGPKADGNLILPSRRRQAVDLNRCSTERNFITPVRAMTDFLLKPSDLEGLRKTKRRSPYENDPPITVYWRKDVEAKAIDVWGSKENLLKEILKRDIERRRYQQNLFTVKRRLRDYRREQGRETEIKSEQNGLFGSSGKVVLTAIAINGTNFLFKLLAWVYTGSHSMFSEAVHSLADTINQLILAYGIHKSIQRADSDHPYGYTNMRYVSSLISGVGIFCVGSGLSFYHGFMGLTDSSALPSFYWAYFILGGSLASEGATLLVAFNSIRIGARKSEMSFSEYVWRAQDPSVNVVLLEDMAAVIGVAFAGCCMGLSSYFNSHIPDAVGSFFVGGLLAGVASFIIYTNVAALVGRSIPQERLDKINAELESDVMIRAIHDVKGIDIGNSLVRYKAEMDFDGGELTRSYLDKQDLNQMLEDVKKMQTIDELEEFMLKHGENIVDMMGGEIDRIELKLRKKHPEIRHCDLEIL